MRVFGMNNQDGSPIEDEQSYLKQSIHDILSTPLGSRIMRRNYGSNIIDFIDSPLTEYKLIQIQAHIANTLLFQEKNMNLTNLKLQQQKEKLIIKIEGHYLPSGNVIPAFDMQLQDLKM